MTSPRHPTLVANLERLARDARRSRQTWEHFQEVNWLMLGVLRYADPAAYRALEKRLVRLMGDGLDSNPQEPSNGRFPPLSEPFSRLQLGGSSCKRGLPKRSPPTKSPAVPVDNNIPIDTIDVAGHGAQDVGTQNMTVIDQLRGAIRSAPSVYSVAIGSGVAHPILLRFLSGERDIRLATAAKLCAFFGLELRPSRKPAKAKRK
jgi:DNA-binding phage protein